MVQCIEIQRYRERTALVRHFADEESTGAASNIIGMIWRYRSPIQWGRGGGSILHSHGDNYLPLLWLEEGEGGDRTLWFTVIYEKRLCI
jgi:hypothetical protein